MQARGSASAIATLDAMRSTTRNNPFDLDKHDAYSSWKRARIENYPTLPELVTPIADPAQLTRHERNRIKDLCARANMAIYQLDPDIDYSKKEIAALARQLGLKRLDHNLLADEDSLTTLRYDPAKNKRGYIPYSNRRINWHTDGYYNAPDKTIFGMLLHCEQPAAEGGENVLLDHEMAYIMLRDIDPEYIRLLMQPDAMTIPANTESRTESGEAVRGKRSGPVFSVTPRGNLHMRYTARTRSIEWKENTLDAVNALTDVLNMDSPWKFCVKLGKGQGLVCNNILHTRTGFDQHAESSNRLLYRARYHDRIEDANTAPI